ncbi:MAG TPA: hypothetical protein DCS93_38885 [Microscillaceae bacterium]|nr:hypothetical protein [Microscillaceae bacterium]
MDYVFNHWLKFIIILLFTLSGHIKTQAQNAINYANPAFFFTSTSQPLADMTGSTDLIGAGVTNTSSAVTSFVTAGQTFEVWFMGTRFTQFSVNTNGVLQFGNTVISTEANTYAINTSEDRISPISSGTEIVGDVLPNITGNFGTAPTTGKVHYKLFGAFPNRYIVVEWKDMRVNYRSSSTTATFQAYIYETTPRVDLFSFTAGGRIFYAYGEMPTEFLDSGSGGTGATVQVGLGTGTNVGDYLGINLTGAAPVATNVDNDGELNSSSFVNAVSTGLTVPLLHTTNPANRRVINFEVPDIDENPSNFQAICITDTKIDLTWVDPASTDAIASVIYRADGAGSTDYNFIAQIPLGTTVYSDGGLTAGTTYNYRIYLVNEGKLSVLGGSASVLATTGVPAIYSNASGSWNDPTIWTTGTVPTATDDVVINCSDVVSVDGDATCRNLQINNTSRLQFYDGGHTLAISGDFTNFGTFDMYAVNANATLAGNLTHNGGKWIPGTTSTFTFNGTGNQIVENISSGTSDITVSSNTLNFFVIPTFTSINTSGAIRDFGSNCSFPNSSLTTIAGTGVMGLFLTPVPAGTYDVITAINLTINHANNEDVEIIYRNTSTGTDNSFVLSADNGGNGVNYSNVTFYDYSPQAITDFASVNRSFANESFRPACQTLRSLAFVGNPTILVSDDAAGNDGTLVGGSITLEDRETVNEITFCNLVINNTNATGITLNSNIRLTTSLTLTDGVINTGANEVIFMDNATATNGSNASYIDGVVRKFGDDAFVFPVGDNGYIANIAISAPGNTTDAFTAQYFHVNPDLVPYDRTSKDDINLTKISACEYWIVNRVAGGSSVNLSLSYEDTRSCGVGDPAQLKIAHWNGTQWNEEPRQAGTLAVGSLNGITTTNPVTSFSPFTLATQDPIGTPLPAYLLSFDILKENNDVLAKWRVLDETQVAHYQLQRSPDGSSFQNIGDKIPLSEEKSAVKQYVTRDNTVPNNATQGLYYRLKIVNTNGSYNYSDIKNLKFAKTDYKISYVAPNPFQRQISISLNVPTTQEVAIQLKNITGQVVYSKKHSVEAGNNLITLEQLDKLPKGPYILSVEHANGKLVRTILKN